MQKGSPNRAGFGHGQEDTYFRIVLVLAILKVVFPELGFSKVGFSIRGTFRIRENGLHPTHLSITLVCVLSHVSGSVNCGSSAQSIG